MYISYQYILKVFCFVFFNQMKNVVFDCMVGALVVFYVPLYVSRLFACCGRSCSPKLLLASRPGARRCSWTGLSLVEPCFVSSGTAVVVAVVASVHAESSCGYFPFVAMTLLSVS